MKMANVLLLDVLFPLRENKCYCSYKLIFAIIFILLHLFLKGIILMTSHIEQLIEECAVRKSLHIYIDADDTYTDQELLHIIEDCAINGSPMPKGIGLQNDVCAYCSLERIHRLLLKEIESRKQWLQTFVEKYEQAKHQDDQH